MQALTLTDWWSPSPTIGQATQLGRPLTGFGIGIANIRQRLELLYGGRAEFKMVEEDRRCQVTIAFPAVRQH
jgi:sensor histidine kinase YesM